MRLSLRVWSAVKEIFYIWNLRNSLYVGHYFFELNARDLFFKKETLYSLSGLFKVYYFSSPFFDELYYREANPDVLGSTRQLVLHYVQYGFAERRSPSRHFDVQAFSKDHPHLDVLNVDLAEVCIRLYGSYVWQDNDTSTDVDLSSGLTVSFSSKERRTLYKKWARYRFFFDAEFYLKEYPEAAITRDEAFMHYMHCGFSEDRQPRADFDGYYYRKKSSLSRGRNPFCHCVNRIGGGQVFPSNVADREGIALPCNRPSRNILAENSSKKIIVQLSLCIHVHCFYVELFNEIIDRLRLLTLPVSLVVTVCSEIDAKIVNKLLIDFNQQLDIHVIVCENRGRDIAPFLVDASPIWRKSDLVLHLHTKRSPHISWGDNWRRYLFDQTIGDETSLKSVVDQFQSRNDVGMMYPENYCMIRHFTEEERNSDAIHSIAQKLRLECNFDALHAYPAGSMAFYRVNALAGVLDNSDLENLFEREQGQLDGTTAHAFERLLPEVVRLSGFETLPYFVANADLTD
ncbi:hypothetical protein GOZ83_28610 [Agrobacterium vitis]|uniref:rhamnan synthesis F family protein n=1 Tax=Rhizobium/Agrobacterium group TaxID=227290 RepID=UPI0012E899A3|nr:MULTISPECIES: rhamnan synthesis F family protein [Rhizobium/Agrobacterium group]MCF1496261.1 hypothetical protein [Allorhizobium ampelinum]MVA48972.1 hypothetical protein [Agrobacterium vitis]